MPLLDPTLRLIAGYASVRAGLAPGPDLAAPDAVLGLAELTDAGFSAPVTTLEGIERCTGLRSLCLSTTFTGADLRPLSTLEALEAIELGYAPGVTDWSPLLDVPALRTVTAPVDRPTAEALRARGVFVRSDVS